LRAIEIAVCRGEFRSHERNLRIDLRRDRRCVAEFPARVVELLERTLQTGPGLTPVTVARV
jgi:hypothetical protein